MMPNKSIYRDADAAEINLYELNFARFFSIQTSENGWRRVVCELVRRAAKGTKELRLDRKSTRLNSSHYQQSRMPSSA